MNHASDRPGGTEHGPKPLEPNAVRTVSTASARKDGQADEVGQLDAWPAPADLGAQAALESITSIAAPLLAGFSATLGAVVVTDYDKVRWPGVVTIAAALAVILLIASVQFGAWGRRHQVTPGDYSTWFDDVNEGSGDGRPYYVREMRRQNAVYRIYAARARWAYSIGIAVFLVAFGAALCPPTGAGQAEGRWVAAGLAWCAAATEVLWGTVITLGRRREDMPAQVQRVINWVAPRP